MIKLHVDEPAAIPLAVEPSSAVAMTVTEAFIEGGANIQNNKNATPSSSQVVVTPDAGYDALAKVTVAAIPPEYIIPTGTKNITANGNAQDVKAYEKVNVSVPNSYSASDEGKVVSNGALVSQTSDTVTTNDTYDTTLINSLTVNVSGGGTDTMKQYVENTLTSFTDSDVTALRDNCFYGSGSELISVSLPNVTTLGENAFRSSKVANFNLPKAATLYGNVFNDCKNVVNLVLPAYVGRNMSDNIWHGCKSLQKIDLGSGTTYLGRYQLWRGCTVLDTIVLRASSVLPLSSDNSFQQTPFKSGGTGGTIYIPKSLYDHLGDGTADDYEAATNWSTVYGYGTITWAKIEGSQYENYYVDGTPIPTP